MTREQIQKAKHIVEQLYDQLEALRTLADDDQITTAIWRIEQEVECLESDLFHVEPEPPTEVWDTVEERYL